MKVVLIVGVAVLLGMLIGLFLSKRIDHNKISVNNSSIQFSLISFNYNKNK